MSDVVSSEEIRYTILRDDQNDKNEIVNLFMEVVFGNQIENSTSINVVAKEPLTAAGALYGSTRELIEIYTEKAAKEGLSLIAKWRPPDTIQDRIVGVIINEDLLNQPKSMIYSLF